VKLQRTEEALEAAALEDVALRATSHQPQVSKTSTTISLELAGLR
jgi:hypothetical protein